MLGAPTVGGCLTQIIGALGPVKGVQLDTCRNRGSFFPIPPYIPFLESLFHAFPPTPLDVYVCPLPRPLNAARGASYKLPRVAKRRPRMHFEHFFLPQTRLLVVW